ncbi:hypothetical protein [Mucilaginibacter sp.]
MKYFDLKGYFMTDSARLSRLNPLIYKTVKHNNATESKKVHITNWGTELSLFSGSDINKPSWKDSYKIIIDGNTTTYLALDSSLKTRKMMITKETNGKVKSIIIFNSTNNALYKTKEKLSYFPDSLYSIQKLQSVKLFGTNNYAISGSFNQ